MPERATISVICLLAGVKITLHDVEASCKERLLLLMAKLALQQSQYYFKKG